MKYCFEKHIIVLLILLSICNLPKSYVLLADDFSLEDCDNLIKKTDQYIEDGGLLKAINADIYRQKDILGENSNGQELSKDSLIPNEIEYSVSHSDVTVNYLINGSKTDCMGIGIGVTANGECSIRSHSSGSSKNPVNKRTSFPCSINEIMQRVKKIVESGKLIINNQNNGEVRCLGFSEEMEYVSKVLRSKIPDKIRMEDLILAKIRWGIPVGDSEVEYCIKPTMFKKNNKGSILACAILVKMDGKDDYFGGRIIEASYDDEKYDLKVIGPTLKQAEVEDIYETVFRYMIVNASSWDQEIKIRFLTTGRNLGDDFYNRFAREEIPVRTPFKKYQDYKPESFMESSKEYFPNGEDALFYHIGDIVEFDQTHIFIDCSVEWDMLAARGYTYFLEKKDGKWKVVWASFDWLS